MHLTVHNTYMVLSDMPDYVIRNLAQYVERRFTLYDTYDKDDLGRPKVKGKFYTWVRGELRLNVNSYARIYNKLRGLGMIEGQNLHIKHIDPCQGDPVDMGLTDGFELLDYQPPIVEFATKQLDYAVRLIATYTGSGKTIMTLAAVGKLKTRTLITLKPGWIDQWVEKVPMVLTTPADKIRKIGGSKNSSAKQEFVNLISDAGSGNLTDELIFMSNKTYQNYLSEYEESGETSYGVPPSKLARLLGVGCIVVDEIHTDFNMWYKFLLYNDVKHIITLSGTYLHKDRKIARLQGILIPVENRFDELAYDPYIHYRIVEYRLNDLKGIRTSYRGAIYSHNAFESSLIRNVDRAINYVHMIELLVRHTFLNRKEDKQKFLIFVETIKFASILAKELGKHFPDLAISKYTQDEEYAVLMESDGTASTPGKAGTAVDIPGLISVYDTTNHDSWQLNKQKFGRLRNLKGYDMFYFQFVCMNIPKHRQYQAGRDALLGKLSASRDVIRYDKQI